jgi:hypothetical protein
LKLGTAITRESFELAGLTKGKAIRLGAIHPSRKQPAQQADRPPIGKSRDLARPRNRLGIPYIDAQALK